MTKQRALALVFAAALLAGCTVKESEDAEGDKTYDIDPARIEVGTDTATVKVPDIDIVSDSAPDTTTAR
jgi:hypothetical protein